MRRVLSPTTMGRSVPLGLRNAMSDAPQMNGRTEPGMFHFRLQARDAVCGRWTKGFLDVVRAEARRSSTASRP